jgi:hypothetical protein
VITAAVLAGTVYTGSHFVQNDARRGSAAWLNAAQLETLAGMLNDVGAIVWPKFASDPFSCTVNATGAYYYNTTSDAFNTCDGASWSPSGGGVAGLTNFDDAFLTSPADNDVLRYVSANTRWENSAATVRLIEDLSDVVITDETFPELLQYNGSNWVDQSALPASLPGLTDTTITAPIAGDHLIHDGSDWKNQPGFNDVPVLVFKDNPSGGSLTNNNVVDVANELRVYRVVIPQEITISSVHWRTVSVLSASCSCQGVAIYSADGNTLHGSGTFSQSGGLTSGTNNNVDVDDFTIGPGEYWIAYTGNFATFAGWCSVSSYASTTTFDQMANTESIKMGTGTNTSNATTCAFPSTIGTITSDTNKHRAFILFEGS